MFSELKKVQTPEQTVDGLFVDLHPTGLQANRLNENNSRKSEPTFPGHL